MPKINLVEKTCQSGENIDIHSEFCSVGMICMENSVRMTFGAVKGSMSCENTGHFNLSFTIARGTYRYDHANQLSQEREPSM